MGLSYPLFSPNYYQDSAQKETILFRLTEIMFQKQQTFLLLDELYEDEVIGSSIRNIQIDSPFQQLLFEGVLSQSIVGDSISVSFTGVIL